MSKSKSNPNSSWSTPARVGVGAAVGYLLLGPVGGIGGAALGTMYKLEKNPGPGFVSSGKRFSISFPNGYTVVSEWKNPTPYSRFATIKTFSPGGIQEGESEGWGPTNFARHLNNISKIRKRHLSAAAGSEYLHDKLGPGMSSEGVNFSVIFENGWGVRVDPDKSDPGHKMLGHQTFSPKSSVYVYSPNGTLSESILVTSPVKLAQLMDYVSQLKPPPRPKQARGNKLSPIKGEIRSNPQGGKVGNPRSRSTYGDIQKLLKRLGFVKIRQKGSHEIFLSPTGHKISVPIKRKSEVVSPHYEKQIYSAVQNPPNITDSHVFLLAHLFKEKKECVASVLKIHVSQYKELESLGLVEISRIDGPYPDPEAGPEEDLELYTVCACLTKRGIEFARNSGAVEFYDSKMLRAVRRLMGESGGNLENPRKNKARAAKASPAQALITECRRLWDHYCERPNKTRLRAVIKHCEKMAESTAKSVKEERARCMRSARREMKKHGVR